MTVTAQSVIDLIETQAAERIRVAEALRDAVRGRVSSTVIDPVIAALNGGDDGFDFVPSHYSSEGLAWVAGRKTESHSAALAAARAAAIAIANGYGSRGAPVLAEFLERAGFAPLREVNKVVADVRITWSQDEATSGPEVMALIDTAMAALNHGDLAVSGGATVTRVTE